MNEAKSGGKAASRMTQFEWLAVNGRARSRIGSVISRPVSLQ